MYRHIQHGNDDDGDDAHNTDKPIHSAHRSWWSSLNLSYLRPIVDAGARNELTNEAVPEIDGGEDGDVIMVHILTW